MAFKAVELDAARRRTGRALQFEVDTREAAIAALLAELGVASDVARVDPTRTLVQLDSTLWTLVHVTRTSLEATPASLRRGGAKHKQVR